MAKYRQHTQRQCGGGRAIVGGGGGGGGGGVAVVVVGVVVRKGEVGLNTIISQITPGIFDFLLPVAHGFQIPTQIPCSINARHVPVLFVVAAVAAVAAAAGAAAAGAAAGGGGGTAAAVPAQHFVNGFEIKFRVGAAGLVDRRGAFVAMEHELFPRHHHRGIDAATLSGAHVVHV